LDTLKNDHGLADGASSSQGLRALSSADYQFSGAVSPEAAEHCCVKGNFRRSVLPPTVVVLMRIWFIRNWPGAPIVNVIET
jgi:hypothetical protein